MLLSVDGWISGSVFECGRCHQWVQQSGGSSVLIRVSFWLDLAHKEEPEGDCGVGAIPPNKYRPSTIVGLRQPEMALQAAYLTGATFEACGDLLQNGDSQSADEKHRAMAVVSVPQLLFANFLRMLFLAPVFAMVLAM